jgi:hypothetical protein
MVYDYLRIPTVIFQFSMSQITRGYIKKLPKILWYPMMLWMVAKSCASYRNYGSNYRSHRKFHGIIKRNLFHRPGLLPFPPFNRENEKTNLAGLRCTAFSNPIPRLSVLNPWSIFGTPNAICWCSFLSSYNIYSKKLWMSPINIILTMHHYILWNWIL